MPKDVIFKESGPEVKKPVLYLPAPKQYIDQNDDDYYRIVTKNLLINRKNGDFCLYQHPFR